MALKEPLSGERNWSQSGGARMSKQVGPLGQQDVPADACRQMPLQACLGSRTRSSPASCQCIAMILSKGLCLAIGLPPPAAAAAAEAAVPAAAAAAEADPAAAAALAAPPRDDEAAAAAACTQSKMFLSCQLHPVTRLPRQSFDVKTIWTQ